MDSLEEHERVLALSRIVDKWAEEELGGEPDWGPLEQALPLEWCGGFMWMSRVEQGGVTIELYKHGITRRYLNLDHEGGSYRYNGERYDPIDLDAGIEWVLGELEEWGWARDTVYDEAFIAAKYKALRDAGWTVITTAPTRDALSEEHQDTDRYDCDQRQDTENQL